MTSSVKRGYGVWSNADTCGQCDGVKDLADVPKLVLLRATFLDDIFVYFNSKLIQPQNELGLWTIGHGMNGL